MRLAARATIAEPEGCRPVAGGRVVICRKSLNFNAFIWGTPGRDLSSVTSYLSGIGAYWGNCVGESALREHDARRRRRSGAVWVVLGFLLLAPLGLTAQRAGADQNGQMAPAEPTTPRHPTTELPKVTIEAARQQGLRRKVHRFVSAVVVRPWDETLVRWNVPICPLVAGLPEDFGEFILWRISKAAADAHAPLAGKVCRPNLFVMGTDAPDLFLRKWLAREPWMYDKRNGFEPIRRFLESKRPVRVWYNSVLGCEDGGPVSPGASALSIASMDRPLGVGGSSTFAPGAPACTDGIDTHLSYADTRSVSSAIVVIDGRQMKKVNIQQLADYIALAALADVRLDIDPGAAPSILRLFAGSEPPPQGLTQWDRALLYSLYNTRQRDKQQVADMESTMVGRIAR